MSTNHTPNFNLCQWEADDKVLRADFNDDNQKIDAALAGLQQSKGNCRIVTGSYLKKGFGILPRAIVWGVLGVCINAAMIVFSGGVPVFLQYMGMADAQAVFAGDLSWGKLFVAFCVSVFMNSFFGPVFMTFHKITDAHILAGGGTLAGFFRPIRMGEIMSSLNWKVQWDFVFKKTIPLFWFPAHTVTFLLPGDMRTLCAALLGVALGILLAVAARKK